MSDWDTFEAFLAEVEQEDDAKQRQDLVNALLRQRPHWPWVTGDQATFIFNRTGTTSAALNLDTIKADPPFAPMTHLEGTSLWHVTRSFAPDDLLDYMLAIDDPMTPLATETNLVNRVQEHWQMDPLNELRMQAAQVNVSVLRMPQARPFPDWNAMAAVPRGAIHEHTISSHQLSFDERLLWVYTPPAYETHPDQDYPLLLLMDARWCNGPLQVPAIADALIKHHRMQPALIAMMQSPTQDQRPAELIANDRHVLFLLSELLPFVQQHYRVDALNLGVGGVGLGAVAAAHAALTNTSAFQSLIMISPPLIAQRPGEEPLQAYRQRFEDAPQLPDRIFQSVGRYEMAARFLKPGRRLAEAIRQRDDVALQFVELGSGHGLAAFKSVFPEALAWTFPVEEA